MVSILGYHARVRIRGAFLEVSLPLALSAPKLQVYPRQQESGRYVHQTLERHQLQQTLSIVTMTNVSQCPTTKLNNSKTLSLFGQQ